MTNPPDEHTDKTTTVTPQLVSKDIEEFVDSGALINVLQANPLDYQGQKVICDTLHKYKMVKEGHTLEPVAGGTVQENYLRFYQQVSQGIKILVTLVAANHRINSGFKSMQNRIAKPNNGFGLCKPSDTSYLRNYQLTNWRHVSVGKDNEGAMVTTMEKVEQGEPTAFSSPVTVHIIVTRQNCSYRDLVNHLLARSEVIGTSNSENSTKSFGRIVNTAAMTQLGVGGVTRPLPSEVGSSQYYITGGVKKTATYFKLQVSDLSKGTETSDLIIKEAGKKIMNDIARGSNDGIVAEVTEIETRKKGNKEDKSVRQSSKKSTLPSGASGRTFQQGVYNGSNSNDVEFSHFTSSPPLLQAVMKYFGFNYEPEFAVEYSKVMMGKQLSLENLKDNEKLRLMIAQRVDTIINVTKPDNNSKILIAANIVTIMLISDEVSNDGKHFTRAIEQISLLKTEHEKDRAYIANFLCECMN